MTKKLQRSNWILSLLVAILGVMGSLASDCHAQAMEGQPLIQQPEHEPRNVARINLGLGLYDSGWYSCDYYYTGYCTNGSYTSYVPLIVGVQVDIYLTERSFLSPGFQAMSGSISRDYFNGTQEVSTSNHITLWEPTLDYVGKLAPLSRETVGRFRVGGALYFGSDGEFGGGFRVGGGVSFFNHRRVGLGLDAVFEVGSYHDNWLSGLQLLFSPEFHF